MLDLGAGKLLVWHLEAPVGTQTRDSATLSPWELRRRLEDPALRGRLLDLVTRAGWAVDMHRDGDEVLLKVLKDLIDQRRLVVIETRSEQRFRGVSAGIGGQVSSATGAGSSAARSGAAQQTTMASVRLSGGGTLAAAEAAAAAPFKDPPIFPADVDQACLADALAAAAASGVPFCEECLRSR